VNLDDLIENFNLYQRIIDALQGTCNSLEDGIRDGVFNYYSYLDIAQPDEEKLEEFVTNLDNNTEFHDHMGSYVFLCYNCGWWCETSECAENDSVEEICTDCEEE